MNAASQDAEWTKLMRLALAGDAEAYRQLLLSITPYIRAVARKRNASITAADEEAEDVVQEVLLAIHLKRDTWDQSRPVGPWIHAIIRNKVIDAFRRRGRGMNIPIEEVTNILAARDSKSDISTGTLDALIGQLKRSQREVVQSISIDGQSIRDTAARLRMSEGAVRVSLHRALKTLAALYRAGAYEG